MELPKLQGLWSEIAAERDDVVFLCVDPIDSTDIIRAFWDEAGYTMLAVRAGEKIPETFRVRGYPVSYLVNPEGRVVYRSVGYDIDRLGKAVAKALGQ